MLWNIHQMLNNTPEKYKARHNEGRKESLVYLSMIEFLLLSLARKAWINLVLFSIWSNGSLVCLSFTSISIPSNSTIWVKSTVLYAASGIPMYLLTSTTFQFFIHKNLVFSIKRKSSQIWTTLGIPIFSCILFYCWTECFQNFTTNPTSHCQTFIIVAFITPHKT